MEGTLSAESEYLKHYKHIAPLLLDIPYHSSMCSRNFTDFFTIITTDTLVHLVWMLLLVRLSDCI